jgi:hypothetical protein
LVLRVTVNKNDAVETWELEGKLSGDWVKELERCWKERPPQAGLTLQVHLKAVSYVDSQGKQLLEEMHQGGAEIKGCGCMARAVVEEVMRNAASRISQLTSKKILTIILFSAAVLGAYASLAAQNRSSVRPSVRDTTGDATGNVLSHRIK